MKKANKKPATSRAGLLVNNIHDWLELIENSAISAMEENESETRETLLETIVETLGYIHMAVEDIAKL